ncbi:hypothetical protein Tco_0676607, partial [Tanacetum coccineum]
YLYEVVAIMESLWLLSSSLSLLKGYILEDETRLLIKGWVAHRSSLAVAADCKGLNSSLWKNTYDREFEKVNDYIYYVRSNLKPPRNEEKWWLPVPWVSVMLIFSYVKVNRQEVER